jgi:signal transduction histidine kinase
MRKYLIVYAVVCAALFAGVLLYAFMPSASPEQEIDFAAINEITKQSEMHWEEPQKLDGLTFSYRFVLLDGKGDVRYASHEDLPGSLTDAIRQGFVPADIVLGTRAAGKALVETSPAGTMKDLQDRQRSFVFTVFVLLCVSNIVFLVTLHIVLIRPFERLQSFAHKISAGRFDEPLPMDKRNLFGLFTQSFDIMRTSLQDAQRRQLKAEREKKELVASLSHDVKTPVTSIRIISELLQTGATDPATIEKLNTIEQKADQIDRLMNDLMHSSLEELGELKVNPSCVESGVLRDLFLAADPLSKVRAGQVPACLIELDVPRMEQVAGNIISNSYKYAGTPIGVEFQADSELLRVDISDSGPGAGPEELELITAKFYRGENAKAMHKEGEGLGLYIAKLLMEKMGGGLEALNRKDGFTVRLWIRLSR